MKFVISEVWFRSTIVEANSPQQALTLGEPGSTIQVKGPDADDLDEKGEFRVALSRHGFNLSNWHATEVK